ncbi:MAG: hypothetical protein ACFFEM_16925, partial [Candidatus Thorarchaeota archaeon]
NIFKQPAGSGSSAVAWIIIPPSQGNRNLMPVAALPRRERVFGYRTDGHTFDPETPEFSVLTLNWPMEIVE